MPSDQESAAFSNTSITINDVAIRAGVSVSTVSRILNNKPDVSQATRERVLQTIKELGFVPHASAQRLAGGKSRTIALLFPVEHLNVTQLELDFFIGAAAISGNHDYFFNVMTEPLTPNSLLTLYRSGQVDATILMQIRLDDWRPALLRENGFPFVMIGRCENNEHYDFIDLDFEGTILTSFEHLVGLGHRHIGFITRPTWMRTEKFGVAVRLYRGYERAVEQFGLVPLVREVNLTAEDVARATEEMLAEQPNLSALVISNGAASVGAVRTLIAHGRQVPRDASVIALATDKIAGLITPQLTSIRFPTDSMGELAARLLIRKMEQAEHRTEHHLLAPALVERESTAQAHR